MICVRRGLEPPDLPAARSHGLAELRRIVSTEGRTPASDEISGYKEPSRRTLWERQHAKCCFCEHRIEEVGHDVEHFRPKASADRSPGSAERHGYWWLAFDWTNLLFACPNCNRWGKGTRFPLAQGSQALLPEEEPPGAESPLLLDPGGENNPVAHIQFRLERRLGSGHAHWWATPREGSPLGHWTIETLKLNRDALRGLRTRHVDHAVRPCVTAIVQAWQRADLPRMRDEVARALGLIEAPSEFVGVSYDALVDQTPPEAMTWAGLSWPEPAAVCL